MYLSHACVSFTYNWYYLHLIRVPFSPLSLSLYFFPSLSSSSLSHLCFGHMISLSLLLLLRHSTGCHSQRSNLALSIPRSCYVGLPPLPVDDHVDNLGAGEASFSLRLSLFGLRLSGFSESNGELCIWEPFRVARCPHSHSPFPTPILHSQIICIH